MKYFCLQYRNWKQQYSLIDGYDNKSLSICHEPISNTIADLTSKAVDLKISYFEKISMIESIARETDPDLSSYILKGVTEGLSYNNLKTKFDIPCSRDTYYDRYRKFFWLLNVYKLSL